MGLFTSAQVNKGIYNSLLWRIEGKGLSKPSYLFGTMHVTDKRVFYFGDSLYKSLEECEGFAAELDINQMMTNYINKLMNREENEKIFYLKDTIQKNILDKYKKQLEKKFKKPVNKITLSEVEDEQDSWAYEFLKKGEMTTFMDAYLFEIARRQGKWVGGIEDFDDQFNLMDEISIESKIQNAISQKKDIDNVLEWMIKAYVAEDLEVIDRSNGIWQGDKDIILFNRNVKMARRIDSLGHTRSCFFAIGAAHIPGDSGVVNLLRNSGFTVTPVVSSRKIAPESYKYAESELLWTTIIYHDSSYSLDMPGKPESFAKFEKLPLDLKMYFEMGEMRGYITMNIDVSAEGVTKDSLMKKMANNYRKESNDFTEKKIQSGNLIGKELTFSNESGYFRLQLFLPGSYMVINALFILKKEKMYDASADKYFNSFRLLKEDTAINVVTSKRWKTYTFTDHAFSIELPVIYKNRIKENNDEDQAWNEKFYDAIDITGGAYYGLFIRDIKPGYYNDGDSVYFEEIKSGIRTNLDATIVSENIKDYKDYPSFEAVYETVENSEKIVTKILLVSRGNRRYMLITSQFKKNYNKDEFEKFFSSFELLPYRTSDWESQSDRDQSFTTWSPAIIKNKNDSASLSVIQFSVYDSLAPATLGIDKDIFPSYYWISNDSILYEKKIKTFMSWDDSLIYKTSISNGNVQGIEILIYLKGTHNRKKMRLLLNGDTLYTLYTFLPESVLQQKEYRKFFEDFRIKNEVSPANLFRNKAEKYFKALLTTDSTEFETTKQMLDEISFTKSDLPILHRALLHPFIDFSPEEYCIHDRIISIVVELADESTVKFVKDNYNALTGDKEALKYPVLRLLARLKTKEAYSLMKDFLLNNTPVAGSPSAIASIINDSLLLGKTLFPEFLQLSSDKLFAGELVSITKALLDSNLITISYITAYQNEFIKGAAAVLKEAQKEVYENGWNQYKWVELIGLFNDKGSNDLLQQFSRVNDLVLKKTAIIMLANNNQQVDPEQSEKIAADKQFRVGFYEELKEIKKEKHFTAKYMNQRSFAESEIWIYATDDYEPSSITFIGERMTMFMDKKQKFYLFKIIYEFDDETTEAYLGVAGPYSLNTKQILTESDAAGIITEEFDPTVIDIQFKKYLKETEDWLKKNRKEFPEGIK